MTYLREQIASPVFLLALTIGAFLTGTALQRRVKSSLCNPTLIAVIAICLVLRATGISYERYFASTQLLHFMLGPATVALAIPLVQSLEMLKKDVAAVFAALLAGSVTGAVSAYVLVRLCGGDRTLALTMMPKSLTTPIAMEVAHTVGGVPSVTVVFAILAGILTAVLLPSLLRWTNTVAAGLAAGTAGSGIATSRVISMGAVPAAYAGVAIGLNGLITSAIAPSLARLLARF